MAPSIDVIIPEVAMRPKRAISRESFDRFFFKSSISFLSFLSNSFLSLISFAISQSRLTSAILHGATALLFVSVSCLESSVLDVGFLSFFFSLCSPVPAILSIISVMIFSSKSFLRISI